VEALRERTVAGSASSNGRSVLNAAATGPRPWCHTILIPLAINGLFPNPLAGFRVLRDQEPAVRLVFK
jgi:hypothetical protein